MADYGALSLIPPLLVVVIAIITRLSLEPIVISCLVGYMIIAHEHFFGAFIDSLIKVMQNEQMVWVILVCTLYGGLIQLMIKSGGVEAFSNKALKVIKTPKKALLATWAFSSFLFVDDYLDALTAGSTMRKITDPFKISREMLAFVISSTAVTICVIMPISTWVIFIGKLLETSHVTAKGTGVRAYLHIIPFISYGWMQFTVVPLTILGIIPIIGKMKQANKRAYDTGQLIPPHSEGFKIDIPLFEKKGMSKTGYLAYPLIVLLAATVFFDLDALKGILVALSFTIIYYLYNRVATFSQISDSIIEGVKGMIFALILLVFSYVLKNLGDDMGLTTYVIKSVQPIVSKELLPLIIFISLGVISFATGNSWGLYAIAIPLVVPLAIGVHANLWMCIGAVVSAGAFGAHACFYSDATVLAASGTECNNFAHAITQLPYALISFTLACISYLVMGYLIT